MTSNRSARAGRITALLLACATATVAGAVVAGCADRNDAQKITTRPLARMAAVDLADPSAVATLAEPVELRVPRNAWASFAVRVTVDDPGAKPVLRVPAFAREPRVYQVLPAPVDFDRAEYVRRTGGAAGVRQVPRVLLPLAVRGDGTVDLSAVRDPARPTDPAGRADRVPVTLWVDLRVPADAKAGPVAGTCDVLDAPGGRVVDQVAVKLTVAALTLPDAPRLRVVAPLVWEGLAAGSPGVFESLTPWLLSRQDARHGPALAAITGYLALAHEHRLSAYVPRVQPIVKWPLGRLPTVDWAAFDGVVGPWLDGSAFADRRPTGLWPMPGPDALPRYDLASRAQYWRVAADHFAGRGWVARAPVVLADETNRPAGAGALADDVSEAGAVILSTEARQALAANPAARAVVPERDDQVRLSTVDDDPAYLAPVQASRLFTRAAGVVYPSRIRDWPTGVARPEHWVDATVDGAVDGAVATEQDARSLAWLAYLRGASIVGCRPALSEPAAKAIAGQSAVAITDGVWFYPGAAFGVAGPLPTLQLKWMRQAEQDYECLTELAATGPKAAAEVSRAVGLVVRPVEVQPGQRPDAAFGLVAGTVDPHGCDVAGRLLLEQLAGGGKLAAVPAAALADRSERWLGDRRRPTVVPRGVRWLWNVGPDARAAGADLPPGQWITATLDLDVYQSTDEPPVAADLTWAGVGGGWQVRPQPTAVPAASSHRLAPATITGAYDLTHVAAGPASGPQVAVTLNQGDGVSVTCPVTLPVAQSVRRQRPLRLDGDLSDWDALDAIHLNQPLVPSLTRPGVQAAGQPAGTPGRPPTPAGPPASIYSGWSDDDLYLAFELSGVTTPDLHATRNFPDYQAGQAWGEDLCELLVQPVYTDDTLGPTLHVVCKPGTDWVERKAAPTPADAAPATWEPFEGSTVRYASALPAGTHLWRGELAIPWKSIAPLGHGRPYLLRLNVVQHRRDTGQSAGWAGPTDGTRDTQLMGLLLLPEANGR